MKAKIKLFLWFITISIIPLLIMGGFSYYLISAKISRQYEENINNINKNTMRFATKLKLIFAL